MTKSEFPRCENCLASHDWQVKRYERIVSTATTRDKGGPFQDEQVIDSDLEEIIFSCLECDAQPDEEYEAVSEAYYETQ